MKQKLIALAIGLVLSGCGKADTATEVDKNIESNTPNEEYTVNNETKDVMIKEQLVDKTVQAITSEAEVIEEVESTDLIKVITDPTSIVALVNKKNELPSDYVPSDLVVPNVSFSFSEDIPKRYLRKEAAQALEELFTTAKANQIELLAASGYRSYARQEAIFASNLARQGEQARNVSAVPGQSEHQTGLAMDLTSDKVGFGLTEEFGETPEGIWLKENAHIFGFIIRYPEGMEHITGYTYEPWHVRYVGKKIANEVYNSGLTLEEFFASNLGN